MTYVPQDDTERNDVDDEGRNSGHAGDESGFHAAAIQIKYLLMSLLVGG